MKREALELENNVVRLEISSAILSTVDETKLDQEKFFYAGWLT